MSTPRCTRSRTPSTWRNGPSSAISPARKTWRSSSSNKKWTIHRRLAARPTGEAPLTAVRNAFRQTLEQLQGDATYAMVKPRYLTVIRLIDSTPALLAASLRYVYDKSDKAVAVLEA